MPRRLDKTAADYIAIAVSPALIMTLVGSLVFFLLEVFYQGEYEERLRFILASFVFAAVLIGRISIEEGKQRAALFAVPLAMAVGLAIAQLVEHRGPLARVGLYFDWALLGVIWWCAHKLTWDCTMIDEQQDATGQGLLQVVGLDKGDTAAPPQRLEGTTAPELPEEPLSWWQRLLEGDRRPHAPGVWVVYFSLAALPIFGLGQLLVPAASLDRRQYVFRLLAIYVASGLGLLITTSFLGIRRYLRQRQVEMPGKIAGNWIGVGAGLAAALLFFALLLPRPNAEYAISSITGQVGSPERYAARYAPPGEGAKDKNNDSRSKGGKDAKGKYKELKESGEGGAQKSKPPGDAKNGEGKQSGGSGAGEKKSGEGKSQSKETGKNGDAGKERGKTSGPTPDTSKDPQSSDAKKGGKSSGESQSTNKQGKSAGDQGGKSKELPKQNEVSKPSEGKSTSPRPWKNPLTHVTEAAGSFGILMKWLFYAVLAALAFYFGWRYRAELAGGFKSLLQDLKNFWRSLFGGKQESAAEAQLADQPAGPSHVPFAAYGNPFASGMAARLTTDELITYTFQALEAWAREHGCPRAPDETPQEFAAHLASAAAPLAERVRRLALLYSQVCYAPETVALPSTRELELLWRQLSERGR